MKKLFGVLRIMLGWVFFWAFVDKVFGLGFSTKPESSWLKGGSPTAGFLKFAVHGPLAEFYHGLAGSEFVTWLFMTGLLLIGLALILGIGMKIASYSGALLLILMYTALVPPAQNPFLDEHLVYAVLLVALNWNKAGRYLGFGNWWSSTKIVSRFPSLE